MSEAMLARDLLPARYRALPIVRLFLPAFDADGNAQRWSSYLVNGTELTGSTSWFDVWDRYVDQLGASASPPEPSRGFVDPVTAQAINDALQQLGPTNVLHCLSWAGYAPHDHSGMLTRRLDDDYVPYDLPVREFIQSSPDDRVPEFANDDEGRFAWGTFVYPDSVIIAADIGIYRHLLNDVRLDTVSIVNARDILPVSSGD
ncbi:hypothetical protein JF66_16195 [Cryobacterium sp. MLB-32]|uniref:hypothetical protein n=1 Tax=Cryobacterium sp. MLB-32 TaxID=1529318 RepID=UPI0004E73223|nr:hypothetical protein [Cryobacterium sp. MLB-32]KFF58758.1 hypothetical protein JF66_16195 [Cryobacterium sp. MLB-32]